MEKLQSLKGHTGCVWHLDWSPEGEMLASCGSDRRVLIWRKPIDQWVLVDSLDGAHSKSVRKVKWSRTGVHLASASFDGTIVIWRVGSPFEAVLTLEGHESEVKGISWSIDDGFIATCGRDKTIWIWETDIDYEYTTVGVLSRHTQDIKCIEFHSKKPMLASGSYDNTIIIWELESEDWHCKEVLLGHEGTVWDIRWINDNLCSASDDLTIRLWVVEDDNKFHLARTVSGVHSRSIYSVDWADRVVVSGAGDDAIAVYEDNEMRVVEVVQNAHLNDVNCVRVNLKQGIVASAGDDGIVSVWKIRRMQEGM